MWKDLGLDLETHDQLLNAVGQMYKSTFLSQKNRPQSMEYFDFVMSEIHGLRIQELVDGKKAGRVVVGSYCVFVPEEIVLAAGGTLVGLCAGADFATDKVEELLPRNTCALIKSAFGFKLGKVCPYLEAADIVVGENTCDGKKKAYEPLKELIPSLYVMDLPQMKTQDGRTLLKNEYKAFAAHMENTAKKTITVEGLKEAIELVNSKRKALHRLAALRKTEKAPISGLDALLANQVSFYDDPQRFTDSVNKICDELEERIKKNVGVGNPDAPRIILSGCPMAVPNWKVPSIVENSGAIIVAEESCIGERGIRNLVSTKGDTVDALMDNLVDRYFKIDCAVFTPNEDRLNHIVEMVQEYNAQGVIHYSLQFCQPYQIEALSIEKELQKRDVPCLRVDTDYSPEDSGQLATRIEAFIEQISMEG